MTFPTPWRVKCLLRDDFGYEWSWTWDHAIAAVVFTTLAVTFARLAWKWWSATCAALAAWAVAGVIILNVVLGFSLPIALPSEQFLAAGQGRVLDAGAGSGRSALMVLLARPRHRDGARCFRRRVRHR